MTRLHNWSKPYTLHSMAAAQEAWHFGKHRTGDARMAREVVMQIADRMSEKRYGNY